MLSDVPLEYPQVFAFVLIPEYSMMSLVSAMETFRLANKVADRELYKAKIHTLDGDPVLASNGKSITLDGSIENIDQRAVVVVIGGMNVQHNTPKKLISPLRDLSRHGHDIGSLGTGSHVLAVAGLLDGYLCTTHWQNIPSFVETFPDINMSGNLYEIDRNRFTSAGGATTIDLILAIITEQHGANLAEDVAEQVLHMPIRNPDQNQRMSVPTRIGARHPKLVKVIEIMEDNLEEPWTKTELAAQVGLSTRQLERLFKRYLNNTPKRFYLDLRLNRARLLLLQTNQSIVDVSLICGFSSSSHFSNCYRSFFGRTPYRERGIPEMSPVRH